MLIMSETLDVAIAVSKSKITISCLNILNLVTKDIQDRIYYIEDVLETQELNQESPVSNNIFSKVANDVTRGISRIGRASRTQLG